jgi:serine/threonine protein kinase
VLDVGVTENGQPYMVLELLEGNDLERELAKRGRLPVHEAVDYVLQTIEALAEAHAAGIVHRDLKPANLFLATRPDRSRIIKVLDFGISKSTLGNSSTDQASLTQTGMMMGSPLYMSPEQMQSTRDTDTRCDIWSLGVVLYQLLTGTTPFCGDSILELCAAILTNTPRSVSSFRDDVPSGIDEIVAKCLQHDRELRYANVAQLAAALAEHGPASARVHAERAARVVYPELGNDVSSPVQLSHRTRSSSQPEAKTPDAAADAAHWSASPTPQPQSPSTQTAWDSSRSVASSRSRFRRAAVLVTLLGAAGLTATHYIRTRSKPSTIEHAAQPGSALALPANQSEQPPNPPSMLSALSSASPPNRTTLASPAVAPHPTGRDANATANVAITTNRKRTPGPSAMNPAAAVSATTLPQRRSVDQDLPDYGGRR